MRQLSCDEVMERLPLLVVGDLDQDEQHDLDAHGVYCAECAAEIAESRRLAEIIDDIPRAESLNERIAQALPVLRSRLMAALPRRVGYGQMRSPLGPLYLVVSDQGLCAIHYHESEEGIVAWGKASDLAPTPDQSGIQPFVRQLDQYFAGEREVFDVPVDLSTASPFARRVLEATARVRFGHLATYKSIAHEIGEPGATRAVGNALGSNPIPIVVPCHRVVRSDGSLGGYTGGTEIKRHLLTLEKVMLVH
ncbi:MAG TPA: methylated-DNA--[protein]-cysteine S-methyltransferase [Nitrolancea sp.]|jgi:methylated-DNA-[protein]-cysteine S-methyltransferase|nr:methylated-DNA--[protein]-cysteine S-methyltransferase [Nitrolancea sp.]